MQILLQIAILLAVQKLARFRGSRVNERRGISAGICPFQKNCPEPCKRGFTLQYLKPVVVSIYKLLIFIEMLPHEGNLIMRNSICQCRTFIWPSGRSTEFWNHRRCQFTNSECCGAHDSSRWVDSNNFFHAVSTRDTAIRSPRESVLTKCENNGSECQQANFLSSLDQNFLESK